ncbi:MAG: TonB-dependent siderophore receptor [Oceanibaculum sp.]
MRGEICHPKAGMAMPGRRRKLARALLAHALLGGTMLSTLAIAGVASATQPASAQQVAQAEAVHDFAIAPQPLAGALDRFAERTGLSFAYRSDAVAGLSSPGLTGSFTATEGLRRLLAGTGAAFQFTGASTVTITRPEAQGAVTLDTVAVEGRRAPETASGPVEGFVATRSATGTKTDTPLIETPQAINVVTRDQMEAQGSTTLTESLRYTPGVVAQYGNNDVRHDWLTVRGFTPGRYLDGMRLPFGARGYSQPRIEPFGLERVEVLKGPASLLYGQGNPGGTVNMVKKRPTEEEVREIELQTGSFDRMQAAIDLGGKANDEGTLLYRMVALGRKSDTQFDYVEEEKVYVAPSLTWLASDNTKVTFFGEYQEIDAPGGGGAPALPAVGTLYPGSQGTLPRETFVGEPGYDHFKNRQWFVGYELDHRIDDTWSLRQNLRYGDVDTDSQRVQAYCATSPCDPSALGRYAWAFPERARMLTVDNQAVAEFRTGSVAHKALVGFDYSYEDSTFEESQLTFLSAPFDAYNPTYGAAVSRLGTGMRIDQERRQIGLYLQDQMKIDRLTLVLGGRYDMADTDTRTRTATSDAGSAQDDRAFTGRVGAVYNFDNGLAPYASYSTSFQPASGSDRSGSAFDPTEGEQFEVGIKFQPAGSRSFITLAAYQLTQQNVLTPDPADTRFNTQTGEVRVRGLELEGKAQLTGGLSLIASYAYTDSEITKANANASGVSTEGNRLAFVPKHQAAAWLDYEMSSGPLNGLGFGAGARYIGQTYGDNANNYDVPGYTLIDAGIRYDLGKLGTSLEGVTVALDASNLFDKDYVATCLSATGCYMGVGRTVYATLKYRW